MDERVVAGQGQWAGASFQGSGPPGERGAALPAWGWDLLMGSLSQDSREDTGARGLRAELESMGSFLQLGTGHPHLAPPGALSPGRLPSPALQADPGAPSLQPQVC